MSNVTKVYKNTPQEHAERATKKSDKKTTNYMIPAFFKVENAPFF